eukprot:COSAG05_NODE_1293_length_5260_cov_2.373571_6_plen_93_part_00
MRQCHFAQWTWTDSVVTVNAAQTGTRCSELACPVQSQLDQIDQTAVHFWSAVLVVCSGNACCGGAAPATPAANTSTETRLRLSIAAACRPQL